MACAGVIVASGKSRRMGFDKLAVPLAGEPVLLRAVKRLCAVPEISRLILVCDQERFDSMITGDLDKPVVRVDGGAERQDSVYAGLSALQPDEDFVAVHDGARPLVSPEDISACIAAAHEHGAATLARKVTETIKRVDDQDMITGGVDRTHLWLTETPQVFRTELLLKAYDKVKAESLSVTDEVSALEALGIPTKAVASKHPNPKITVAADLEIARALLD